MVYCGKVGGKGGGPLARVLRVSLLVLVAGTERPALGLGGVVGPAFVVSLLGIPATGAVMSSVATKA